MVFRLQYFYLCEENSVRQWSVHFQARQVDSGWTEDCEVDGEEFTWQSDEGVLGESQC